MKVLLLTVYLSLLLAALFLLLFLRERRVRARLTGSVEQDALRPLDTEIPRDVSRK